jgi:metal-sulfur cluster biosynthetic enzyme
MTLTSPHCPVAESLPIDVEAKVSALEEVSRANVEIVWEPTWNPEMMSEAAKLELGFL